MTEQSGFFFDAELPPDREPVSFIAPVPKAPPKDEAFITHARTVIDSLDSDDLEYDAVLGLVGIYPHALASWHRARVLDLLIAPDGLFTAYLTEPDALYGRRDLRFRRRLPFELCRGGCGQATRGGAACGRCSDAERRAIDAADEDRLNQH